MQEFGTFFVDSLLYMICLPLPRDFKFAYGAAKVGPSLPVSGPDRADSSQVEPGQLDRQ